MAERGTEVAMTDDEFWALLREKQSRYRRPPMPRGSVARRRFNRSLEPFVCAALMRLDGIEYEAWHRSTEEIPLWLKNELKYLDVDLNFHREVALKIQRFLIAEDEYNGADEDEPWWKLGLNCETEPPSQRLTQRVPRDQGWPEDGSSLIVVDR